MPETIAVREVVSLSRGARVCVLGAVLLLLAAAYLLFAPIEKDTSTGQAFGCGSALNPAQGAFPEAVCGKRAQTVRLRAGTLTAAAMFVGLGGVWVFGVDRRTQRRRIETDYLDSDADE
jgi:hypothetical protein